MYKLDFGNFTPDHCHMGENLRMGLFSFNKLQDWSLGMFGAMEEEVILTEQSCGLSRFKIQVIANRQYGERSCLWDILSQQRQLIHLSALATCGILWHSKGVSGLGKRIEIDIGIQLDSSYC